MAEEERQWLQRHAHESNTLSYGHVGRATYNQQEQSWNFLRCDTHRPVDNNEDINDDEGGSTQQPLRLLGDAETAVEATRVENDSTTSVAQTSARLIRQVPEFTTASSIVQHATREDHTPVPEAPTGQLLDFGSAVWLGAGGIDSGNLKVPIYALITGPGADVLRLTIPGKQSFNHEDDDGIVSKLFIPSVRSKSDAMWASVESILQVVFSSLDREGRGNTFLAVRQASRTSIFQPLLPRSSLADSELSNIDPNLLLSIDTTATGGHAHADGAFQPRSQRDIAIIDIQGNWSIWNIKGRRSHTARILHQAHLKSSGKIFSWAHKRRPEEVGLYFDGWHKVIWLSSNGNAINRLFVCNRQDAKLFDLKGNEVCSIDVRLDTQKVSSYILDVKPGPDMNLCFLLTTSKLLLFDLAQKEWRDKGRRKGPALLCAWQHFHNSVDMSLRMAPVTKGEETLVVLYSTHMPLLRLYQLQITKVNGQHSVVSSDPTTLKLPDLPASSFSHVSLTSIEVASRRRIAGLPLPTLLQITFLHENLAASTILAAWRLPASSKPSNFHGRPFLRLPPERGIRTKSERRVDELDDEEDLAGFIAPVSAVSSPSIPFNALDEDAAYRSKPILSSKHILKILNHMHHLQSKISTSDKDRLPQSLHGLTEAIEDPAFAKALSVAVTIAELLATTPRVEDIEADSATLTQALGTLSTQTITRLLISSVHYVSSQPLVQTYEQTFDTYVSSLSPTAIPDRIRVHRERLAREIALDLHLSSHTIRRQPQSVMLMENSDGRSQSEVEIQNVASSDAIVFSDPIESIHAHSNPRQFPSIAQISASQPQPSTSNSARTQAHPPPPSQFEEAMSRLSVLTPISRPPPVRGSAKDQITGLLAHLPESANAGPETYDWAAAELRSVSGTAFDPSAAPPDAKARRKAERLAKARNRAESVREQIAKDRERRSIVPTVVSSTQPQPRPQARAGEDISGRDGYRAMLPIRSSPFLPPRLPTMGPLRPAQSRNQPAGGLVLSDPNPQDGQPESSSQARAMGEMASTQPERGVFGARSGVDRGNGREGEREKDKSKKKKKRVAGF